MQFSSICPQVDSRILPLARGCFSAEVLGSLYDGLPWWGSDGQESACGVGELGLIPGLGRSPGKRNGNPLQYSCLENPMDRAVWQATVHAVAKSRTREGLTLYSSEHIKCLQRFLVPPSCNPLWKCQPWNKRSFALPTPFLFHDQLEGGHPALCVPILIILHHFRDSSALVNLLKILTLLEDW